MVGKAKVGLELGLMDIQEAIQCLQLDDDLPFNEEIQTVGPLDEQLIVLEVEHDFALDGDSRLPELMGEASLVGAFQ